MTVADGSMVSPVAEGNVVVTFVGVTIPPPPPGAWVVVVALEVVEVWMVVGALVEVEEVFAVVAVVPAVPGTHWEYQSLL